MILIILAAAFVVCLTVLRVCDARCARKDRERKDRQRRSSDRRMVEEVLKRK